MLKTPNFADLNKELNNLREDQKKEFTASVFTAYKARSAKEKIAQW